MKLGTGTGFFTGFFTIKGHVYSGSARELLTGALIRTFSYKDKDTLVEETSPSPSAYLLTGSGNYESSIWETCHGINQPLLAKAGKTGDYNFYMAPYGPGYYQPPVGELPTMAEQTIGSFKVVAKQIDSLNLYDYLKIFGLRITSKINNFIPCKSYPLTAFHEGITDCPITSKPAFKYSEIQAELAAGTYLGSIGGNIYNHNPIPSSYDRGVLVAKTLYSSTAVTSEGPEPVIKCLYDSGVDEKPIPVFERKSSAASSNYVFGRCESLSDIDRVPFVVGATDAHTNASVGNPKDIISDGDLGQDTSNYDQGVYWHFIFKNNHDDALPFGNTHEVVTMTQDNDGTREDHWWEHRECPENIDYLNHAFGNNINACPMNYLDVPYYAAIGKFGYFGTRFQDTWRKVDNDFNEPIGWIHVWNISGYSNGALNAKTIIDKEWVTSPEDNSLYKISGFFSGLLETPGFKDVYDNGVFVRSDPIIITGAYLNFFQHSFYADSGVTPTPIVEIAGSSPGAQSGLLFITDEDSDLITPKYTGISWDYYTGDGPDPIPGFLGDQFLSVKNNPFPPDKLEPGILDLSAMHITKSGAVGNIFNFLELNLSYYKKKKYIDYPYATGEFYKLYTGVDGKTAEYYPHSQMIGTSDYEDLISSASIERRYYDFAFSDRSLFLALNYNLSLGSTEYAYLNANIINFQNLYAGLCGKGMPLPGVGMSAYDPAKFSISNINRGASNLNIDDPVYSFMYSYISTGILNEPQTAQFDELIRKFGSFKCFAGSIAIDRPWYDKVVNEKKKRISARYYSNIANGDPVDLFPNNQVTFSFEKTLDFANSDLIKYGAVKTSAKARGKELPAVKRQYFSAGFSTDFEVSGYLAYDRFNEANNTLNNQALNTASYTHSVSINYPEFPKNTPPLTVTSPKPSSSASDSLVASQYNFYLGYVNPRGCGSDDLRKDTVSYLELINLPKVGVWLNKAPQTSPPPAVNTDSPARKPWPDFGFNRVGKTQRNFSCFSPLFLQQPINEHVKLCQAPKFRIYATDYHSITEDKIEENRRGGGYAYPEVAYWLRKIKAINSKAQNMYPLSYQWYRVLKTNAKEYLDIKKKSLLQTPSSTGPWCCAEDSNGRTPECTVIRPLECLNLNGSAVTNWSGHSEDSVGRFMGVRAPDDAYYYFCNVTGRFGWRSSEFAEVEISTEAKIEVATMNLCGGGNATLFMAGMGLPLALPDGYLADSGVYFEQVKDKNWNDRNNCESVRFIGPEGVRGITRVYTPSTFVDPRGKKVRNAHWKDFGSLVSASFSLNTTTAARLYADRALPYCDRASGPTWAGTPFNLANYIHRTHFEPAILTDNTTFGVKASKMRNIGELYPPKRYSGGGLIPDWDARSPGHWQFENNLGSIKKYSSIRSNNTINNVRLLPDGFSTDQVKRNTLMNDFENKIKLAGSKIITGPECGYVGPSMGRLMHFYVESLFTYYLLCEVGGVKPKKVKNFSHIAGGLRSGRAGLQYNWLGKPNDSRLKRVSMPGPYAFQWKVERHNRDRNGNGMPLSFWSYHWEKRMEDLYDAAAVYGAVKKTNPSYSRLGPATPIVDANGDPILDANGDPTFNPSDEGIRSGAAASISGPGALPISLRGASIGPDDGPKLGCGGIRWKASGDNFYGVDRPNSEFVLWMERVANPAGPDPFSVNGCGGARSQDCFYPCVSLKYPEGFTPRGGKSLGYKNGADRHYITTSIINSATVTPISVTMPAGSVGTSVILPINISPCSNNKKDICNYITPTIHIGIDTWPYGVTSNNSDLLASISNM